MIGYIERILKNVSQGDYTVQEGTKIIEEYIESEKAKERATAYLQGRKEVNKCCTES